MAKSPLYKTARWRDLRLSQLRRQPACEMCMREGRATPATVCHHVRPHRGDPIEFFRGPFQSLCADHHDQEAQQAESVRGYHSAVGLDGLPTDPGHPFVKARV